MSNFDENANLLPGTTFCDPDNPLFHTLSLSIGEDSVVVGIKMENGVETRVRKPLVIRREQLLLTIGNVPRMLIVLTLSTKIQC